jgi:hypothetical protein
MYHLRSRHQTGSADFPHPAFTQTRATEQYADRSQLSSAAKPRSKISIVSRLTAGVRKGTFVQAEFLSSDSACLRPGPFAPRSLPAWPLPMSQPGSRPEAHQGYEFPWRVDLTRATPQAIPPGPPGFSTDLSPRAIRSTPESPTAARTHCFTIGGRLRHVAQLGRSRLHNEAESVHLRYRSRVRLDQRRR